MKQRIAWAVVAVSLAIVVGAFRYLSIAGLSNDHYMHVAAAQQIAMGEWPVRDYVELGLPLMEALSAIPFLVLPDAPLFGEALLVAAMFALAAVFTLYAARRLTGSWWIALLMVALEVVIFPRSYSYPKVVAYAAGFLAMWRYVEQPSWSRMRQLAFVVVVAFGLRHDHGFYLGVGGLATVVAVSISAGRTEIVRRAAAFAGVVYLLLAPYIAFVALYDGIWRHIERGIELQLVESARGRTIPVFTFGGSLVATNAEPWLFFLFHLLPVVVTAVAWVRWRQQPHAHEPAMIVPLIIVAVLVNVGLIRDTVSARLPDAVVPAAMLLGWLIRAAVEVRPVLRRGLVCLAATIVFAVTMISATVVGATKEQLEKAEMLSGLHRIWDHGRSRYDQLHQRFPESQIPSRLVSTLMPFFHYAERCLGPRDHILIPGFAPEVPVWARRPFAGGQIWFQPDLLTSTADHRFVMAELRSQRVPVAIVMSPTTEAIGARFEDLDRYLRDQLPDRIALGTEDEETISIAFDPRIAVGRDHATGWYCFR